MPVAVDTGSLRRDLIAFQRHQIELMSPPESRRVTAGLIADLVADPELAQTYVTHYLAPRRPRSLISSRQWPRPRAGRAGW